MRKGVYVKKLDGKTEKYNPGKLRRSLANSGADSGTIDRIMLKVDKIVYNGISTKELFRFVFREFKKCQPHQAPKYDLKNAFLRLGQEGYVFEKFVSRLLRKKGYACQLNRIVQGKYVTHEIDIIAKKSPETLMVEAKYHNKPWIRTGIQTALYVYARFLDSKKHFTKPMLVTNTKFSSQSIQYAEGVGLRLMGWKYPKGDSLEFNAERLKIYPVTMIGGIGSFGIKRLFANNILLVNDLVRKDVKELSKLINIPQDKAAKILETAKALCNSK